jgi:hypothetical protein
MQKEKASLRCNSDTNLIRYFETVTALKTFLGNKNLDVAEKLGLIFRRKPVKKCNVALDRCQPIISKRCGPQTAPSALF